MVAWNSFSYICTNALYLYSSRFLGHCCAASTVIPLLPNATFTPSIQPSLVKRFRFTSALLFLVFCSEYTLCTCSSTVGKTQVPFNMAKGYVEFMHECFPKHSRMGTERTKKDKETDEEGKNRGVSMERSKAGTKENKSERPITTYSKYNNNQNNMGLFYKIWKK